MANKLCVIGRIKALSDNNMYKGGQITVLLIRILLNTPLDDHQTLL